MSSFVSPTSCGFSRTLAFLLSINKIEDQKNKTIKCQHAYFVGVFFDENENFQISLKNYTKNLQTLKKNFARFSKDSSKLKEDYINNFQPESWLALPETKKNKHRLANCEACSNDYMLLQSKFPVLSNAYRNQFKNENICFNIAKTTIQTNATQLKDITHDIYNNINKEFSKKTGVEFRDALCKVKDLAIVKKKTISQKKKERREQYRNSKAIVEKHFDQTAIVRTYGLRQSLNARKRERLTKTLVNNDKPKLNKNHVGSFTSYNIDENKVNTCLEALDMEEKINWSTLAKECNITNNENEIPKNCGQIIKEWCITKNLVEKRKLEIKHVERRKKIKGPGGEITLPTEKNEIKLKQELLKLIEKKEINIGEVIIPKQLQQLKLVDGKIIETNISAYGRKVPLIEIRNSLLEKQRKYMRHKDINYYLNLNNQECDSILKKYNSPTTFFNLEEKQLKIQELETTRHIMIWHDASTIANHSYILFMVHVMYDNAVFFSNDEYHSKIEIQKIVEEPCLYIVGQCASTDEDQLQYIDTRLECLEQMKDVLKSGNQCIKDVVRFFKGDGPAIAMEAGHQKGGLYFCSSCEVHASKSNNFAYSTMLKHKSLSAMQETIMEGLISKKYSLRKHLSPLGNLSKQEINEELFSRNIKVSLDKLKKDVEDILKFQMKGVKRVPALLFTNPTATLSDVNCEAYEILQFEPMHDIAHHIENVLDEVPEHLEKTLQCKYKNTLNLVYGNKNVKRCCDHRLAICKLLLYLKDELPQFIFQMLFTLAEIQSIVYQKELSRCNNSILRLYNLIFLHDYYLKQLVGNSPKSCTFRKMFGKYYHDILVHAPLQQRIISGDAANTEDEERFFNKIKDITKKTSNMKAKHLLSNLFIRLQIENQTDKNQRLPQENEINKIWALLNPKANTKIPLSIINSNPRNWQAHLERISDYLCLGENIWWKYEQSCVEFFDKTNTNIDEPHISHFRNTSLKEVQSNLESKWSQLVSRTTKIPADTIIIDLADNHSVKKKINYFEIPKDLPMSDDEPEESDIVALQEKEQNFDVETAQPSLDLSGIENELQNSTSTEANLNFTACETPKSKEKNDPCSTKTSSPKQQEFKTSLAKILKQVVSNTVLLRKIDDLRHKLKNKILQDDKTKAEYIRLCGKANTIVKLEVQESKNIFKEWEQEIFTKTAKTVTLDDIESDENIKSVYTKIKNGKKILKMITENKLF